jgi:homoaconitase/3-isopropylmalate dehydratase large subunit
MSRLLSLAVLLLIAPAVLGDDSAEARKIVEKGIKAAGKGDKIQARTMKGKGTFYGMGAGIPYTGEWSSQLPHKMRMTIENAFTIVINGDMGWLSANGSTMELTKDQLAEQKEAMYSDWVEELVPLRGDGFTLTVTGDSKVDDKPAVGVKVAHKGHRDVTLYFEKDSGLLVKIEQTVKDEQSGKEVSQVTVIKEYAKVGDAKLASKMIITRDGMNYVDGEMSDFKLSDSLPDSTFEKP